MIYYGSVKKLMRVQDYLSFLMILNKASPNICMQAFVSFICLFKGSTWDQDYYVISASLLADSERSIW